VHGRSRCISHTRCHGNLRGIGCRVSPEKTHMLFLTHVFSQVAIAFAESMHQIGADQMRRMHTQLHDLLQAMPVRKRKIVTSKVQRGSSPDLIAGKPA